MQDSGQILAQSVHPIHLLFITYFIRALHWPEGHFLSLTWATYSSQNLSRVERTGFGAV